MQRTHILRSTLCPCRLYLTIPEVLVAYQQGKNAWFPADMPHATLKTRPALKYASSTRAPSYSYAETFNSAQNRRS